MGASGADALVEIERELVAEPSPDRLFRLIVQRASRLFGAECGIHLPSEDDRLVARADTDPHAFTQTVAMGEGVAGRCADSRRGWLVNDYPAWPHAIPWAVTQGLQHVMAQPLVAGPRLLGVIVVSRRGTGAPAFHDDDLATLEHFAALAAVVIHNAALYAEAERRRREAEVLTGLVSDLNRSLELDTVLSRVVEGSRDLCASDAAKIAIWDADGRAMVFRHQCGNVYPGYDRLRIEPGRGMGGYVIATGRPVRTAHRATDPRFTADYVEVNLADGHLAELVVPITIEGRVEGLIYVSNRSARSFTDTQEAVVARLADHAAIAIHNARLFSERQRTEQALRESEARLQHAQKMQAVGRLAGGIAHDFNNLLTVIGGRAQMLLAAPPAEPPRRRDLELVASTVERAARLTQQLLAFSRKQVLEPVVLDLGQIVRGMAQMLQRLIGENIELSIEDGLDSARVYADRSQLEQVLLNLAVNSRDAMPEGGRLTISVGALLADAAWTREHPDVTPGSWLVLTVRDTGVGMDAETRSHVFEPFFTTKGIGEGTGLGLATVYGIVRQTGGHVDVESEPGQGATFRVYLPPFEGPPAPGEAVLAPDTVPRGSETILLVEDEQEVRELLHESLTAQGYRVWTAGRAEDARAIARAHPDDIDLLITDVVLPGGRGDDLARELVGSGRVRSVLYISGYPDTATLPRAIFLPKPLTPAVLARKAREVLDTTAPHGR